MIVPVYDYSTYFGKVLKRTLVKNSYYCRQTYSIEFLTENVIPLVIDLNDNFEEGEIVIIHAALQNNKLLKFWEITKPSVNELRFFKLQQIFN